MAISYLGCSPLEAMVWTNAGRTPALFDSSIAFVNNYMELVHNVNFTHHDADEGDGNPGSRGGVQFTLGAHAVSIQLRDGFLAPSQDYRTYAYKVKLHNIGATGTSNLGFITSHKGGTTAGVGNCRIIVNVNVATNKFDMQVQVQTAGGWANLPATATPEVAMSSYEWIGLQIDANSSPQRARIVRNGGVYMAWQANADIDSTQHEGTPSPGGDALKGAAVMDCAMSACVVYDNSVEDDGPTSSDDVLTRYPNADGSSNDMTASGNESCHSSDKWAAVDDAEDDEPSVQNSMGSSGDQLFEVPDLDIGAVPKCVAIGAMAGILSGGANRAIIKNGADTLAALWTYGNLSNLAQYPLQPDGSTAWDRSAFNASEFGMRGGGASGFYVAIYGTGMTRQSKAAACPAGAAFVPRVMVY